MSWRRGALLVPVLLLGAACSLLERWTRPLPPPASVTLFLTADFRGYIEPCGCSQNMRGGLARSAQVVLDARAGGRPVLFIDSGDGLFPAASIPEAALGQQSLKAQTIARAFTAMGLTLRAPGPFDDARGPGFRLGLGLPELPPGSTRHVFAGGFDLAVISAASLSAAEALAHTAREEGAVFIVALLPTSIDVALKGLIDARELDLVLASRPRDELSAEENRMLGGATHLAQVQNKGRTLLRVDLTLRDRTRTSWLKGDQERDREVATLDERIELTRAQIDDPTLAAPMKALRQAKLEDLVTRRATMASQSAPLPPEGNLATYRFVPIEASLPQEAAVADLETDYDREVGALNLAWAKANGKDCEPATPEDPGLIGTVLCSACHLPALAVWQKTKHPQAYADLEKQGKQYHLDCIGCHVDGWQKRNGVCRVDKTEDRQQVSCESCHGPGSTHLANPVKENMPRPKKEACVGCHDHENSPHFDFETYVTQIKGPGHGLPMQPEVQSHQ